MLFWIASFPGAYRQRRITLVLLTAGLAAASCTGRTTVETPTASSVQVPTSASPAAHRTDASPTRAATVMLPQTPQTQSPLVSTIPRGDYIVYARDLGLVDAEGNPYRLLELLAMDGTMMGQLEVGPLLYASLAPDARRLALVNLRRPRYVLAVVDLLTGSSNEIQGSFPVFDFSWSPSGDALVMGVDGRIIQLSLATHQSSTLIECQEIFSAERGAFCGRPLWSPDGKWLAFGLGILRSGPADPRNGVYLADTECIEPGTDCTSPLSSLPSSSGAQSIAWSPDSRFIAYSTSAGVIIFDAQSMSIAHSIMPPNGMAVESMAWSPEGEWIAYQQRSTLGTIDPTNGVTETIADDPHALAVLFWLRVPLEASGAFPEPPNMSLELTPSVGALE
jgi:hypothetical protein